MNNEVLEQLKQEYNELLNRAQDIGEIIANCMDDDTNHCGQDAAPAASQNITCESLYELLGYEVICFLKPGENSRCEQCPFNPNDPEDCVKVELVGGSYLCLAKPQQDKPITELDDSQKSLEEVYRDSMNLLREFCIKQSEANQRLVEALKEASEELKKPVISFDDEEGNVMDDIKEKTEAFLDYLDSVVKG